MATHVCECKGIKISNLALVDCGCKVNVHEDGSGVEIYYCPMHGAGEDTLLALEAVQDELKASGRWMDLTGETREKVVEALECARRTS